MSQGFILFRVMDGAVEKSDVLLTLAASRLRGVEHRLPK